MDCNNLDCFVNRFVTHSSIAPELLFKTKEREKNFQQFPRWPIMKVNSNICALPGLLPFISLTFRRSSGSHQAQFLSGRSCILLTAAERLPVGVCWWKSPSAFWQLWWKGRFLSARVRACLGQWVIAARLVGCAPGAVELKWSCLAPVLSFVT